MHLGRLEQRRYGLMRITGMGDLIKCRVSRLNTVLVDAEGKRCRGPRSVKNRGGEGGRYKQVAGDVGRFDAALLKTKFGAYLEEIEESGGAGVSDPD